MATPAPYAAEVRRVRNLGIPTSDIAAVTGAGRSTVTAWARADRQPAGDRRARLLELVALVDRLVKVMTPAYVPVWLHKPVPALGDERPLDALARGRYRQVSRLVAELENDTFA
jgi:hypothetical protein